MGSRLWGREQEQGDQAGGEREGGQAQGGGLAGGRRQILDRLLKTKPTGCAR